MAVNKESCEVVSQPKKRDVVEFVAKVRAKALNAVKSEFEGKIMAAHEKALAEHGLYELVEKAQDHLNALVEYMGTLNKKLSEKTSPYRYSDYNYFYQRLTSNGFPLSLKEMLFHAGVAETPALKKIIEERNQKLSEVEAAYGVVMDNIENMRSPQKMVEYLNNLGFDTSYLYKKKVTVDAEKLFPCKERA